jgi:prepilin-type N-terminal cleavage/methylation domain-containing protein
MSSNSHRQKGFTLIELLIVISIIALLSSIVLASVKTGREKALITKTVGEMKSLQTALELYRNKFGVYPGELRSWYDDDYQCGSAMCNNVPGFVSFVQTNLVANKFLAKTVTSPLYPNNCNDWDSCWNSGYVLGYSNESYSIYSESFYYLCGGQKINNYFLYFWANDKKVNLPYMQYYDSGTLYNMATNLSNTNPPYIYCLSM